MAVTRALPLLGGSAGRSVAAVRASEKASRVPALRSLSASASTTPPFPPGRFCGGSSGGGSGDAAGHDAHVTPPRPSAATEPAPPADPPPPGTKAAETDAYVSEALASLDYPDRLVNLLLTPQREVHCEAVITRDSGEVASYHAYRVQHDNSRGPFKGGWRFDPGVSMDEIRVRDQRVQSQNKNRGTGGGARADAKRSRKTLASFVPKSQKDRPGSPLPFALTPPSLSPPTRPHPPTKK